MTASNPERTPDQNAAHCLLSELRTRIATQSLPYQHGVEARALESLRNIFDVARLAMKENPGCERFAQAATTMLNVDLRPFTAKWHRSHESGLLASKDGANEFRADLAALRPKLAAFSMDMQFMAYGTRKPDEQTPPVIAQAEVDLCFKPVEFGIGRDGAIPNAAAMDAAERGEVTMRRSSHGVDRAEGVDAVGLALSGGGIRSATFCLGVVQVLAERKLMKDVDFLSTVSGGGYTGSFVTAVVGGGSGFAAIGKPRGPDTEAVRRLRRNAKYLSAADLKERWTLVTGTVAGSVLNWTAPLSVLAILAVLGTLAEPAGAEFLRLAATALAVAAAVATLAYGAALRFGCRSEAAGRFLGWVTGLSALLFLLLLIERGYGLFSRLLPGSWAVSWPMAALVVSAPAAIRFLPLFRTAAFRDRALKAALALAGIAVPIMAVLAYYELRTLGCLPENLAAPVWSPLRYGSGLWPLAACAAASGAYAMFVLNINLTGPHKLYRDRLAKTFVPRAGDASGVELSGVNASKFAPYHLICATVNLPSSTSDVLRERHGDFFLFSKHWCGSPATGYAGTARWAAASKKIDLATAMAVSGAAASPHMGLGSVPSLSALLTLLNIRLGYWIARPQHGRASGGVPGFICLLREMTSTCMSEKRKWLNVSDGGHIENMGVYELLRRRCKFIVCVDGEADPKSVFSGQLTLVRHAQIDFGIRIEPRFGDIRPDSQSKLSRSHSQLFRIRYPAREDGSPVATGLMLYLKLSMTGDEAELLKRYRAIHPDFPHQSTLDQFYDEEQFEAYRQLGVHVAEGAFAPALLTADLCPPTVEAWFRQLAGNMLEPDRT